MATLRMWHHHHLCADDGLTPELSRRVCYRTGTVRTSGNSAFVMDCAACPVSGKMTRSVVTSHGTCHVSSVSGRRGSARSWPTQTTARCPTLADTSRYVEQGIWRNRMDRFMWEVVRNLACVQMFHLKPTSDILDNGKYMENIWSFQKWQIFVCSGPSNIHVWWGLHNSGRGHSHVSGQWQVVRWEASTRVHLECIPELHTWSGSQTHYDMRGQVLTFYHIKDTNLK